MTTEVPPFDFHLKIEKIRLSILIYSLRYSNILRNKMLSTYNHIYFSATIFEAVVGAAENIFVQNKGQS